MPRTGLLLLAALLFLSACQPAAAPSGVGTPVEVDGGAYTNLNVEELQAMLEAKDFLLVNVHIPFEGDLPDTDFSIPFDQIEQNLDELPAEKDAKIVLYCRSGRMSDIAARELVQRGYTNLWNLDGGMVAWERAGLPLVGLSAP